MSELLIAGSPLDSLAQKKARVVEIRERARTLFDAGTPGIQIAATLCGITEKFLLDLVAQSLAGLNDAARADLERDGAIVAIGGTGRGELCPYSDIDLLFLDGGRRAADFREFSTRMVQSCWDAKLGLGHAVRTVDECLAMARQDSEIATSLIEARLLWGNPQLCERLRRQFRKKVIDPRRRAFVDDCLSARAAEFPGGVPAQELEPNVKCSVGGLRDLHLIRWIGYALFDTCDVDSLRLKGELSMDEAHAVRSAWEFLTRIRFDLHLAADKPQDILTRDEQLRITEAREIRGTVGQRPVERFMQTYFEHSTALAKVARRFAARHRPRGIGKQLADTLLSHRADGILRIAPDQLDAAPRHFPRLTKDVESVLNLYRTSALYGVLPSARLIEAIEAGVRQMSDDLTPRAAQLFMDIMKCTKHLGAVLRSMYDTGVLERVIPDVRHVRCLMQFNQYHHYTVDEHSLRAVEVATRFSDDTGDVGTAYAAVRHKELLHLALLLHDLGKGFEEHHWEVGRRIADRVGRRLYLEPQQREQVMFLVHQHLEMSHIALRRDISDPELVLQFSHQMGSAETLTMLYVLTVADITAVGPEAWTSWKGEFLADLYHQCRRILSGTEDASASQVRLNTIREGALKKLKVLNPDYGVPPWSLWAERQLNGASNYYLTATPPQRIAEDLHIMRELEPDDVVALARQDAEAGTIEFRVLSRSSAAAAGCFHKLTGGLTAKRLEIVSADINTTHEGGIIDSFRVVDHDFAGASPPQRLQEICDVLRNVLRNTVSVETLIQKHKRFGAESRRTSISNLPLRVEVDNDSSDNRTVIDVFAHDRPGLLYTVARAIYQLGLSIDLAKISTHYDQVVDVFYVREPDGSKVSGAERLSQIREQLSAALDEFERAGHRRFVS
ncbi:MAG: [protein-PII] uridylyltransferase [Planctomycetaceae bacterium]|nr:[protein-PII] uridylyltransferase [Planctomycetaceae bacterium]